MKAYRVFFEQENYTFYDVEATNEEEAQRKAIKLWQTNHKWPRVAAIEPARLTPRRMRSELFKHHH